VDRDPQQPGSAKAVEERRATGERERLPVVVADPDPIARAVLSRIIEGVHDATVRTAGDGGQLMDLVAQWPPEVILANEGLLCADRYALLRALRERPGSIAVIMVTNAAQATDPLNAVRAGVDAIIPKASPPEEICDAVESVLTGRSVVQPQVAMALIRQLRQAPAGGRGFRPIHSDLTNREWEILDLLVAGAGTKQIADRLVLSQDTVYTHIKNILRKMHVRSRAEAIEAANRLYRLRTSLSDCPEPGEAQPVHGA
jgi:DNA-binding NarL/FixJ family response regulator